MEPSKTIAQYEVSGGRIPSFREQVMNWIGGLKFTPPFEEIKPVRDDVYPFVKEDKPPMSLEELCDGKCFEGFEQWIPLLWKDKGKVNFSLVREPYHANDIDYARMDIGGCEIVLPETDNDLIIRDHILTCIKNYFIYIRCDSFMQCYVTAIIYDRRGFRVYFNDPSIHDTPECLVVVRDSELCV